MGEKQFNHFFSFFILFYSHHHSLCVGSVKLPVPNFLEDIATNCGCFTNSTAIDGRRWIGETPLHQLKGKSKTSTSSSPYKLLTKKSVDPTPYLTSRISSTHFSYIFLVNPGQKFIRFHFSPTPYHGFENSRDLFIVKANSFTLLDDFSPSFAADSLGVKYIVKEFCLHVNETGILQISFFASQRSRKRSRVHAFVNGIEIISMPTGLYYTPDDNLGARVIGHSNGFYKIDSSIALELIHRLNVGGGSISPVEDTGMFRRWSEDAEHVDNSVTSTESMDRLPWLAAPLKIYETSRRMRKNLGVDEQYYLTVKALVDLGFGYLLRLHFCDLGVGGLESVGEEFDMLIQNIVVETRVDVILWSGGYGIPVYRDYLVMMKGDESEGKYDIFISLQSASKQAGGQLKGLEIFKLSNGDNSLASPYFSSLEPDFAFRTLKSDIFAVAFGQINVFMTLFTILLALVNTVVYILLHHFEGESWHKKAEQATPVEPSCRFFSLEEILVATQNFSDTLVIGRGGFGQVYKGFIYGCPEVLAIKRSKPGSKQGAHEFWREIETLSKLRHIHLVSLIGYCNESNEMILVYEYMPRCTLADNLYKANKKGKVGITLSWEQRLRICIGAARGLDYLHSGTKHGIVHRDVKDTNILLDENFIAKISDFGLAELGRIDGTHGELSTRVRGTMGYLDPDFLRTRNLSVKTDVYAFGMVLLVVLSARPALERKLFAETWSLLSCYRDCIRKGDINLIIDSCLQGEISTESLTIFMEAVKNCLHKQPRKRPTMAQVVVHLEQALEKQQGLPPCISDDETVISQPSQAGAGEPFEFYELKVIESKASSPPVSRHSATATTYSPTASSVSIYYLSGLRNMLQPHIYDFSMISSATNNFQLKPFSSSSSSTTWRCIMHNQEVILIQRRLRHPMKIPELTERFGLVCKSHHASLVKLNGASISTNYIYFVYDYIHGGNLADCLRNPGNPHFYLLSSWMSRIKIAADIAHGLEYIHHSSGLSFNFVHNHIKSTSIIVTPNLNAKICHFGTAELCREVIVNEKLDSKRSASLEMKFEGTTCYVAPEFQETGMATQKSDIYAFGMVILELLSGKDPKECRVDNGGYVKVSLIETGRQAMEDNGIGVRRWVDKRLNDSFPVPVADKLARLGLACLSEDPDKRPDIRAVAAWISRLFVESETWLVEKMGVFPQDISDSLIPR